MSRGFLPAWVAAFIKQKERDRWMVTTRSKRGTFPQLWEISLFHLGLRPLTGQLDRLRKRARVVLSGLARVGRASPIIKRNTRFRRLI
jgi:hypothetical protein